MTRFDLATPLLRKVRTAYRHVCRLAHLFRINQTIRQHIDRLYARPQTSKPSSDQGVLLVDGLWDNPNHFLRLSLFLDAIDPEQRCRRIAVVWQKNSAPQRRTLAALGFTKFIELPDQPDQAHRDQAVTLLATVRSHQDALNLALPGGLPAYIVYDTVLKRARHPQPPLEHPQWAANFALALDLMERMEKLFATEEIRHVVLSHPWGLPFGAIAWAAVTRSVSTVHLTGYGEGIRIQRLHRPGEFATPVEHLPYDLYKKLSLAARDELAHIGMEEFKRRSGGQSTDINSRYAFSTTNRITEGNLARQRWIGDDPRPVVLVCSHIWFDFPHTFAMRNFTDFLDWMHFTLDCIRHLDDVIWVLKPHPTEVWYGGFRLSQIAPTNLGHIVILAGDFDQATALAMCDAVVTVHGTAGLEAGILGRPVLCADRSYYADWPFATVASSREDYARLLTIIGMQQPTEPEARAAAAACFAAALGQPTTTDGRLNLRCDSLTTELYDDIRWMLTSGRKALETEQDKIRHWLGSGSGSYAVYCLLDGLTGKHNSVPTALSA